MKDKFTEGADDPAVMRDKDQRMETQARLSKVIFMAYPAPPAAKTILMPNLRRAP